MIRLRRPSDPPDPPWLLDVRAWLVQSIHPPLPGLAAHPVAFVSAHPASPFAGPSQKYELRMKLELGNPNQFSISLDTIVFRFQRLDGGWSLDEPIEQLTTICSDQKIVTRFVYGPQAGTQNDTAEEDDEDAPSLLTIGGRRGLALPRVPLGVPRSISNEHGPTNVHGHFFLADQEIVYPVTAQLPPRSAIPQAAHPLDDQQGIPLHFCRDEQGT